MLVLLKLQKKLSAINRTSSTSKHEIFLWVNFALLDPDPDPATQINADPCGSGSETPMNIRDWSANKIKSLWFQTLLLETSCNYNTIQLQHSFRQSYEGKCNLNWNSISHPLFSTRMWRSSWLSIEFHSLGKWTFCYSYLFSRHVKTAVNIVHLRRSWYSVTVIRIESNHCQVILIY